MRTNDVMTAGGGEWAAWRQARGIRRQHMHIVTIHPSVLCHAVPRLRWKVAFTDEMRCDEDFFNTGWLTETRRDGWAHCISANNGETDWLTDSMQQLVTYSRLHRIDDYQMIMLLICLSQLFTLYGKQYIIKFMSQFDQTKELPIIGYILQWSLAQWQWIMLNKAPNSKAVFYYSRLRQRPKAWNN